MRIYIDSKKLYFYIYIKFINVYNIHFLGQYFFFLNINIFDA